MTIQDWSPLGWTGWISLQSKGLSRVFSSTTVQMTLNWSSRSENGGAPEMRGWLGEEGSHQGNLGTRPHSSPIAPCACCLHGSSGGDTAPGAVPLRTPQGTEAAASPWAAQRLQLPPEVCLWERQGSEAKAEREGRKRKKQVLKRNDLTSWEELRSYYQINFGSNPNSTLNSCVTVCKSLSSLS